MGVACTGPLENIEKDQHRINAFYVWWNIQSRGSVLFGYPIFPGFNFGVRAKEFWKEKGFPGINMICEDMELSLQLRKHGRVVFNNKMAVKTCARRQKEIPIHKHLLSGLKYTLTKKTFTWDEYRKDF